MLIEVRPTGPLGKHRGSNLLLSPRPWVSGIAIREVRGPVEETHKSSYITGSNDFACVQEQEIYLSKPFRSMSLSERYWISRTFGPCSFLPLLYAEIIRSHLRRPGAQGLLVGFRAPSGNVRHDDVSIFDRWRARE
jgi:hypothetical protein